MDALLALYFRMTSLPSDLLSGWLRTLESEERRHALDARRAAGVERDEEIELLERRLGELRR